MEIEKDNIELLNRFKKQPPHPSYISGFIDGDGCLFIRKIKCGYQSGITITQSRTNILQVLRYHFGGSITTTKKRNSQIENVMDDNNELFDKHNIRNQYNWIVRSNEYKTVLDYLYNSFVIKEKQYDCLTQFANLCNKQNYKDEKESLFTLCSKLNKKEEKNNKIDLSKINIEYIQGLFDAEGCIFIKKQKFSNYYISITQKNNPEVLIAIKNFLKMGTCKEVCKIRIYNKSDCLKFIQLMKESCIVKYKQLCAFETFLNTSDMNVKEQMYKICNEEKHKIENFNDLNQNDKGKEGYLETIHLRECKEKICNEIKRKQIYKEKSENMKGENNHNFGKTFTEETKKKMSESIRNAKQGISDETILSIRELMKNGKKNIEIQKLYQLKRHTITRIKNGDIVSRKEERKERKPMTEEEIAISKRKIHLEEICIVIEKCMEGKKPASILQDLVDERKKRNIDNYLTIDIIKNIKRNIHQNKIPFYYFEISPEKYKHYETVIQTYNSMRNK